MTEKINQTVRLGLESNRTYGGGKQGGKTAWSEFLERYGEDMRQLKAEGKYWPDNPTEFDFPPHINEWIEKGCIVMNDDLTKKATEAQSYMLDAIQGNNAIKAMYLDNYSFVITRALEQFVDSRTAQVPVNELRLADKEANPMARGLK